MDFRMGFFVTVLVVLLVLSVIQPSLLVENTMNPNFFSTNQVTLSSSSGEDDSSKARVKWPPSLPNWQTALRTFSSSSSDDVTSPHPPLPQHRERIALLVPVITTGESSELQLPILTVFLPSLLPTIANTPFDYTIFLGADVGDRLFDNPERVQGLFRAFEGIASGFPLTMQLFTFEGNKGAPCWVWNKLAQLAYNQSYDYFYQVNDDLRFITPNWATAFTQFLKTQNNVGVAGPSDQNNNRIMTQSFVHRTHYDIFDRDHFPVVFRNWFSDDWVTAVYPPPHARMFSEVLVKNGAAGQRYVNDNVPHLVAEYVAIGREKIAAYKKANIK